MNKIGQPNVHKISAQQFYFGVCMNNLPRRLIRVHIRMKTVCVLLIFSAYTLHIGLKSE